MRGLAEQLLRVSNNKHVEYWPFNFSLQFIEWLC